MDKILITGATGLIGKSIIKILREYDVSVIALVRDKSRAINVLGSETERLSYVVGDVCTIDLKSIEVDYIIHCASQTSSRAFVDEPVETIFSAIHGTENMLEFAKKSKVKGFVYLSSMEVYGYPETDEKIDETHATNIDIMKSRSCYPESKRLCENLCAAFFYEYGVPTKVVRLTQTFGPGVNYADGRAFAEFARCVIEKKDIVLRTKGETKRSYLYTDDAAKAIIKVMYDGKMGEAYNVANENTYCSIYEMACMVAKKCGNEEIKVIVEENDIDKLGYAPTLHMNLDTKKIRDLGWSPSVDLEKMYIEMIADMRKNMKCM